MKITTLKNNFDAVLHSLRQTDGGGESSTTKWFRKYAASVITPEVLAVGDTVKFLGRKNDDGSQNTTWKIGQEHIITKVATREGGYFAYVTNRGAWFEREDFELVATADEKSYAAVFAALDDE